MERVCNFGAGPGAIPLAALERAKQEFTNFAGTGKSVMETSHRSEEYAGLHEECQERFKRLIGAGDDFQVLFFGGGATTQFALLPMNMLSDGDSAEYVVTGNWSKKAIDEAKKVGQGSPKVAASSEDDHFSFIPGYEDWSVSSASKYIHITSNNTISGTQFPSFEKQRVTLVADMSSDVLSRPINLDPFSLIYAGAQKNLGPAGVTIVLIRKTFLEQASDNLPLMLSYKAQAAKRSLLNTPPCFNIYMVNQVLHWLEDLGGVDAIHAQNTKKSDLLYDMIDKYGDFYRCPVRKSSRSRMNIVFRLPSTDLEKRFIESAKAAGMIGLKGHRSVGGIRASIYNAAELPWVEKLVQFMEDFRKKEA